MLKTAIPHKVRISSTALLLIILLGAVVYANSISGAFLYDDSIFVEGNVYIKTPSNLPRLFITDVGAGAGSGAYHYNFYRPIQMLTYMADYHLWGLDSTGYHITNILLHIAVAVCIYILTLVLFGDNRLSFVTAALFIVHPVHTEAVSYISGRADLLSTLFILLFLIWYIKSYETRNPLLFFAAALCYCLALLSKEYSLVALLLLVLCHYVLKLKAGPKRWVLITAISAIYVLLRTTIFNFSTRHSPAACEGLLQRLFGFFAAIAQYLKLLILPANLHMEYTKAQFALFDPWVISGIIITAALLLGLYAWRRRDDKKIAFFSIAWFFISILPVSNLYPINAYMAEHWLYVPSIGFFLTAAWVLKAAYGKKNHKIAAAALFLILLGYYSFSTIAQNNYWKDPMTFYERTLRYGGGNVRIYNNLGLEYAKKGDYEKAIALYRKAIETGVDTGGAYNNLGNAYMHVKKTDEALKAYKAAIKSNPNFAESYNNLGSLYSDLGRKRESVEAYSKAIELNPLYATAHYNLALEASDPNEAIRLYKKAVEIDPGFAAAYYNISIRYEHLGNEAAAAKFYRKAKSIDPDLP